MIFYLRLFDLRSLFHKIQPGGLVITALDGNNISCLMEWEFLLKIFAAWV
jgi:hypothetical protein